MVSTLNYAVVDVSTAVVKSVTAGCISIHTKMKMEYLVARLS